MPKARKVVNGSVSFLLKLNVLDPEERSIIDILEPLRNKRGQKEFIKAAILSYAVGNTASNENLQLLAKLDELIAMVRSGQLAIGQPIATLGMNKPIAMPDYNDEEDTVIIRKDMSAGAKSAENFLNSFLNLQSDKEAPNIQTR